MKLPSVTIFMTFVYNNAYMLLFSLWYYNPNPSHKPGVTLNANAITNLNPI